MVKRMICGTAAALAVLAALTAGAQEGPAEGGLPRVLRRPTLSERDAKTQKEQVEPVDGRPIGRPDLTLINDIDPVLVAGDYWLGVLVSRPSSEMQAKWKLPKDQGLLVEVVQPGSPAAAAGIKPNDVLLKANDKPLGDLRDLVKLINDVKEGKLSLQLIRDGKPETVIATPAKRPGWSIQPLGPEARAWIEQLNPRNGLPSQFHIIGPGQIIPPGGPLARSGSGTVTIETTVHIATTLADGSQVEITREDGKPAKVVVIREKERWEGTADDLSKIPEKTRPEVERLLTSPMDHVRFFASPTGMAGAIGVGGPNVERRLNEMQKQIDELKQQLKALQDDARAKKD